MNPIKFGEPVASRKLTLLGDNTEEVIVEICKPIPYLDTPDYCCSYRVEGMGFSRIEYAVGIDSFQSLILAIKATVVLLNVLNKEHGSKLRWVGDESGDLGFPFWHDK